MVARKRTYLVTAALLTVLSTHTNITKIVSRLSSSYGKCRESPTLNTWGEAVRQGGRGGSNYTLPGRTNTAAGHRTNAVVGERTYCRCRQGPGQRRGRPWGGRWAGGGETFFGFSRGGGTPWRMVNKKIFFWHRKNQKFFKIPYKNSKKKNFFRGGTP